jgi:hypothetical protein
VCQLLVASTLYLGGRKRPSGQCERLEKTLKQLLGCNKVCNIKQSLELRSYSSATGIQLDVESRLFKASVGATSQQSPATLFFSTALPKLPLVLELFDCIYLSGGLGWQDFALSA